MRICFLTLSKSVSLFFHLVYSFPARVALESMSDEQAKVSCASKKVTRSSTPGGLSDPAQLPPPKSAVLEKQRKQAALEASKCNKFIQQRDSYQTYRNFSEKRVGEETQK